MNINEVRAQVTERLLALPVHEQKVVARENLGYSEENINSLMFEVDYSETIRAMGDDGIVEMWEDMNSCGTIRVDDDIVFVTPMDRELEREAAYEINERRNMEAMEQMYERQSRADQGDC